MTNLPKFSTALLHPRYWLTWLGIGVLWLVVQLPYPVIYRLGCGLGKLALRFMRAAKLVFAIMAIPRSSVFQFFILFPFQLTALRITW